MPAFGSKISEAEARGLVSHVRGFAKAGPGQARPAIKPAEEFDDSRPGGWYTQR
jgi:hypothetical protein